MSDISNKVVTDAVKKIDVHELGDLVSKLLSELAEAKPGNGIASKMLDGINNGALIFIKESLKKAEQALSVAQSSIAKLNHFLGANEAIYQGASINLWTILVLAIFVGYYVIWNVTPALHSPLMAVTNATSSVIIVGGMFAFGDSYASSFSGFIAVLLAAINIAGGFMVTHRMLAMFHNRKK